jgi:predicted DNA-binding transcriptional regulator AlpA
MTTKQRTKEENAARRRAEAMSRAAELLPRFIRFEHLHAAGITDNRAHLKLLLDDEGFPPGRMLSPNMRVWTVDEVEAWLAARPIAKKLTPTPRPRAKAEQTAEQELSA